MQAVSSKVFNTVHQTWTVLHLQLAGLYIWTQCAFWLSWHVADTILSTSRLLPKYTLQHDCKLKSTSQHQPSRQC